MKHLDVTFDLETASLSSTAAIIQIGAVAWNRFEEKSERLFEDAYEVSFGVDLRSAMMSGFDIDPETCKWWSNRDAALKNSILSEHVEHIKDVLLSFKAWLEEVRSTSSAESICLWAQGSDFDVPVLRNAFETFDIEFPVNYHAIRDARSVVLETFVRESIYSKEEALSLIHKDYNKVYDTVCNGFRRPECLSVNLAHNALYDAKLTAWSTWCALHGVDNVKHEG